MSKCMERGIKSPRGTHAGLGLSVDRAFGDQRKKPDCLSRKETIEFAVSVSYIQIPSFRWVLLGHAYNPNNREAEAGGHELEASMG